MIKMKTLSVFGDDGVTQIPFTGCMNPERINNIIVRQSNVDTARNVKNGCPKQVRKKLRSLSGILVFTLLLEDHSYEIKITCHFIHIS